MLMLTVEIIHLSDAVQIYASEKQEAIRETQDQTVMVKMIAWPALSPVQPQNARSTHNAMTETSALTTYAVMTEHAPTQTTMRPAQVIVTNAQMMYAAEEAARIQTT